MSWQKFRLYFSNTRYGYKEIKVYGHEPPSKAANTGAWIEKHGEFPKCLDNIKDNGWVLEDISLVEENNGER